MKPITICNRTYIWAGVFLLILCAAVEILLGWHGGIALGTFLGTVFCALGSQRDTFSETGIESRFLWWHSVTGWKQVIQAGITKVSDQGHHGAYLLLTYSDGVPKTPGMGFRDWKQKNGGKCLYVPADQSLRELVIRCYGPLDFESSI